MENKLGIYHTYTLEDVERKLVNFKLSIMDEYFTFNELELDFSFLMKLHEYLFGDLYEMSSNLDKSKFNETVINEIDYYLDEIHTTCVKYPEGQKYIIDYLYKIWELQPFHNGNTRTLMGYLIIINKAFNLGFYIDVSKEMKEGCDDFSERLCVVREAAKGFTK